MTEVPPTILHDEAELMPSELPPSRTDTPSPAWTVFGLASLPGMILLWFMPKRVGASLAASGWLAAIAAHLVAMLAGIGLLVWTEMISQPFTMGNPAIVMWDVPAPDAAWSIPEYIRFPYASLIIILHAGGWPAVLVGLAIEVAVFLFAVALMPVAAAGEYVGRLFGRCLRLALWGSTMMLPIAIVWTVMRHLCPPVDLKPEGAMLLFSSVDIESDGVIPEVIASLTGVACFLWWLSVLVRSGMRYAGPAEGPGWTPRLPRCEGCGYIIAQISKKTNCPECGKPVEESLPERRSEPVSAKGQQSDADEEVLSSSIWSIAFSKTFFSRLAVHRGHARSRSLYLARLGLSAILMTATLLMVVEMAMAFSESNLHERLDGTYAAAVVFCGCFASLWVITGVVTVFVSAWGRRPFLATSVTTLYAFSAVIPSLLVLCAGAFLPLLFLLGVEAEDPFWIAGCVVCCAFLALIPSLAFRGFACLRMAFRDTRLANG